ncbi:hypothetical protein FH972_020378 [Carpinus fangiana]|uniref:3-deoxy-8-phosphooctulonate synthase n=1 Tax=Carpinus fangiana TaxID=176857 RepID=A0A5N6RTA6_9ROSI|nr:hypothetical protein FH972_020378 [Carpinus fangiana]
MEVKEGWRKWACLRVGLLSPVGESETMNSSLKSTMLLLSDGSVIVGGQKASGTIFLLAGPNVIESDEHVLRMAKHIKTFASKVGLPLVFKSSFDKANRTSTKSFRGPGMIEGLKVCDVIILFSCIDVFEFEPVGRVADIIQIPAFLCRQTDLLVAAAKTGKIVNIKKGQFCAPSVIVNSAEKVRLAGNPNVMVCERKTMFGYCKFLDLVSTALCHIILNFFFFLVLDGGGVASGGLRELIPCIARTAVAVGVDGLFMELQAVPPSPLTNVPSSMLGGRNCLQ